MCGHTVHVPNSARCSCKVHAWYGLGVVYKKGARASKIAVVVTKIALCRQQCTPATHPPLSPPLMYRVPSTTHHTHTIHTQYTHKTRTRRCTKCTLVPLNTPTHPVQLPFEPFLFFSTVHSVHCKHPQRPPAPPVTPPTRPQPHPNHIPSTPKHPQRHPHSPPNHLFLLISNPVCPHPYTSPSEHSGQQIFRDGTDYTRVKKKPQHFKHNREKQRDCSCFLLFCSSGHLLSRGTVQYKLYCTIHNFIHYDFGVYILAPSRPVNNDPALRGKKEEAPPAKIRAFLGRIPPNTLLCRGRHTLHRDQQPPTQTLALLWLGLIVVEVELFQREISTKSPTSRDHD